LLEECVSGASDTQEVSYGRRLTEIAAERGADVDLFIVGRDGREQGVPWRELEARANQIARAFEARGVTQDSIVAIALPNCIDHIFSTLAIWKLGATLLPLRHDLPQWEMDRMLAMAKPAVVVSDAHDAPCPVFSREDLAATAALPGDALPDRISECVNLIASSGSTGKPKLIVTPYRGVVNEDPQRSHAAVMGPLVILVTSPLYHVNGFSYASPPLLEGARSFVMEKFDAAQAVKLIERHKINYTVMVPTMLQRIARLPGLRPEQFASIERLAYGGAKVPEWVVDRFLELVTPEAFVFIYGSSERIGFTQMTGAEWADHRGATGRPQDIEISIRSSEGEPLPNGEVGEIYMRPLTDRRMFRYIGAPGPEPTPDGFYSIGVLGWVDDEGYLYIADRRKDLIITGGANVFPAEVETALSEHPGVFDQVVVGVPDEEWGHRVHAIIQPTDPAHPPEPDALRAHCRERLAAYKVPKTWEISERLPRTEAGKLNRTSLGAERAPMQPDPTAGH
jgi:bile acid-coenzyme A ligase